MRLSYGVDSDYLWCASRHYNTEMMHVRVVQANILWQVAFCVFTFVQNLFPTKKDVQVFVYAIDRWAVIFAHGEH